MDERLQQTRLCPGIIVIKATVKTLLCYSHTLSDTHCQCVGVQQGRLDPALPLAMRDLADIKKLAETYRLFFILPQTQCSLHPLELSWLSEKKARMAIPYALEDRCSQPLDHLHFSFSKAFYQNGRYLILCTERQLLQELIHRLQQAQLHPDVITSDWFALNEQSQAFASDYLLVNTSPFRGALPYAQLNFSSTEDAQTLQNITFTDSPEALLPENHLPTERTFQEWVAVQLSTHPSINLLQGSFAPIYHKQKQALAYRLTTGLALFWILSVLGTQLWQWQQLRQENTAVEEKIAVIYREFFPQAKQIISPRFRIEQTLKHQTGQHNRAFWQMYLALILSLQEHPFEVNSLRYSSHALMVNISANDFSTLEALQTHLQKNKLQVKQSRAATKEGRITANLELSL
ncbi:MAG: hypothetical protein JJT82_02865 [Legionellaceae bacterium]|nr:hypothetical protein [Legionellaceae bacterium]